MKNLLVAKRGSLTLSVDDYFSAEQADLSTRFYVTALSCGKKLGMQPFKVNQAGNFWAQGFAPGLDDRLEDQSRPGAETWQ